jgi:hypothetical protein
MRTLRTRALAIICLVCVALVNAAPIAAAPGGGNGGGNGNGGGGTGKGNGNNPPVLNATPELSSLALFGTSAIGMAGYVLIRLRAGRRQDKTTD